MRRRRRCCCRVSNYLGPTDQTHTHTSAGCAEPRRASIVGFNLD